MTAADAHQATWNAEQLDLIGAAQELELASQRHNGSLRPYATMWVVRVGDGVYVRSAYGPENPWYRRAMASGVGRIRAGGVERDVELASVSSDVMEAIDAAYHAKYDQYGPKIVGSVVGTEAHRVTIQLVPTATKIEE